MEIPQIGLKVTVRPETGEKKTPMSFPVCPQGPMVLRSRLPGDEITLPGGTKSVKKLFIDRKIPAAQRLRIPIAADRRGVLGICGIGADVRRTGEAPVRIEFEPLGPRD